MKKTTLTLLSLALCLSCLIAQPNHQSFGKLLRKHVTEEGSVKYRDLVKDKKKLENYIQDLSQNAPQPNWSKDEKMAYWINAYNALTLATMCQNYPLNNVYTFDNGDFFKKKTFKANQSMYSLDDIEHDILRPMNDARIHCAINCAAKSSPILNNFAYESAALGNQLEYSSKRFIKQVVLKNFDGKKLCLPKVFEWYQSDFKDVTAFINRYAETRIPQNVVTTYLDYDWSLNDIDEMALGKAKK